MIQRYSESKFWGSKPLAAFLMVALLTNQICYGTVALADPAPGAEPQLTAKTLAHWKLPKELGRVSYAADTETVFHKGPEIGRASCRERV